MGPGLRDAARVRKEVPCRAPLLGRKPETGLSGTLAVQRRGGKPAHGPAFLFRKRSAARAFQPRRVALLTFAATMAALLVAAPLLGAGEEGLGAETACALIRASIRRVARAERNQALALRLMPEGKPTPMVETRLTELRVEIDDLREVLRRVGRDAPPGDQYVRLCMDLGFHSLVDAEALSAKIGRIGMSEGENVTPGPHLKSGEFPDEEEQLPPRPLPGARERPE